MARNTKKREVLLKNKKPYKSYKPYHLKDSRAFLLNAIIDLFVWVCGRVRK
jgi:hypothetical protein